MLELAGEVVCVEEIVLEFILSQRVQRCDTPCFGEGVYDIPCCWWSFLGTAALSLLRGVKPMMSCRLCKCICEDSGSVTAV